MAVIGLFGGYRVATSSWLEINLLKYVQLTPSARSPFSRYFTSPNGDERDLGWEIDLIFEGEEKSVFSKWRYYVVGSYFEPGSAYSGVDEGNGAYGLFVNLRRYW
jgi:hypothetical protein